MHQFSIKVTFGMEIDKNLKGHALAFTANVMWGLMSPIGKSALTEFSALSVTTFRMVGAAAAFWILSAFCKQEQVGHRDMLKIFFASLFALVFNQGIFIFGLSLTSPIDASIVTTTLPIVTMVVAAIYLKEPITNKKVMGYKQKGIGNFHWSNGSIDLDFKQSGDKCRRRKHLGRLTLYDRPTQFLYLPDRIQRIIPTLFGHHN